MRVRPGGWCMGMFRGTVTQTSVHPREVVEESLALNAAAAILAHKHPSAAAEPSRADEFLTHALKTALALVDVRLLDHLIVAGADVTACRPARWSKTVWPVTGINARCAQSPHLIRGFSQMPARHSFAHAGE